MDTKDILYSTIDKIGRDKIRSDLVSDYRMSRIYIAAIIEQCLVNTLPGNRVTTGTEICEALLHFLLTVLSIPSERKILVDNTEVDIVIPSSRLLKKSAEKAIVIQFIKAADASPGVERGRLFGLSRLQPISENIWFVSNGNQNPAGYRSYSIQDGERKFSEIIIDIQAFLSDKGVTGLKLING